MNRQNYLRSTNVVLLLTTVCLCQVCFSQTCIKHNVILAVLYACGLRVSELINLKWQHIDRSRMIINIIQGKGNKDRQVMLPKELILLLEKYFYEYHSKEYLLNGQFGLQYSSSSVLQVMKQSPISNILIAR